MRLTCSNENPNHSFAVGATVDWDQDICIRKTFKFYLFKNIAKILSSRNVRVIYLLPIDVSSRE